MKIYFIGQKGIPAKFGGVEKHVEELATRLVKAGHEVNVYTRPNYTETKLKSWRGVKLISLGTIASKHFDAISHTFRACLDLRKRNVDIIHFHSIGPSSLIWLAKLLKPGVPIIATFHSQCYTHKKWGILARLYLKFGEMIACKMADKTITVSRSLTDYAKEKYDVATEYIPNGVNLPKILSADEISKKWKLSKGGYILCVSRLIGHKGIHYLLEAYKKIKTSKKLVIVGDGSFTGSYVKKLKELAKGTKKIIFTGNQTGKTLAELYANAYLFVQPSESEGLSIALLEALSYGKCALVSDIRENTEVIGKNNNFIFKNKNVLSLKYKLNNLLKQPKMLERIGKLARTRVGQAYNWNDITKSTIKVYKSALLAKPARVPHFKLAKKFVSLIF